jgi:hypothetical protein
MGCLLGQLQACHSEKTCCTKFALLCCNIKWLEKRTGQGQQFVDGLQNGFLN